MNKTAMLFTASAIAASILISPAAEAASITTDGMLASDGQIMIDVWTLAGSGDFGSANGESSQAAFRNPSSILAAADGTLVVSDEHNHMLRQVSDETVSTLAGVLLFMDDKGRPEGALLDGNADHSLFQRPAGLVQADDGTIYVADSGNHAIRKITTDGLVETIAGSGLIGRSDGSGSEAAFYEPRDVAVAKDGTIYVADTLNHLIRKISPSGVVTTLNSASDRVVQAYPGVAVPAGDYKDGSIAEAKFNEPSGLAIDAKGNLYVSDSGNQRIRYIDFSTGKVTTIAGSGDADSELYVPGSFADGVADKAQFNYPVGIAITGEGGLLIADSLNHSIRYLMDGEVTTLAGSRTQQFGEDDGPDRSAQFHRPIDVALSEDGTIYVADALNNAIRKLELYQLPLDQLTEGQVNVVLGRERIAFDVQPEIVNQSVAVPLRAIAERLGYTVEFHTEEGYVTVTQGEQTITLNTVVGPTHQSVYYHFNRTFVPIRFFSEQIGMDVQWDGASKTVILR
ncbi:stalk domain-containing protein [Marinicrinis lubricantis]|uniref:Stalk domain-containing protein n=1 Tax=Marinicrinis lubricantis TaxID=2086470 RepID=A0ABW1ISW3_9BACL